MRDCLSGKVVYIIKEAAGNLNKLPPVMSLGCIVGNVVPTMQCNATFLGSPLDYHYPNFTVGLIVSLKKQIKINPAEPEISPFYIRHILLPFQNLVPTLPRMQHSHWVMSLEAIYQIAFIELLKTCKHAEMCKIGGVSLELLVILKHTTEKMNINDFM